MKPLITATALLLSGLALAQGLPKFGTARFGAAQFGVAEPVLAVPVLPLWATILLAGLFLGVAYWLKDKGA